MYIASHTQHSVNVNSSLRPLLFLCLLEEDRIMMAKVSTSQMCPKKLWYPEVLKISVYIYRYAHRENYFLSKTDLFLGNHVRQKMYKIGEILISIYFVINA